MLDFQENVFIPQTVFTLMGFSRCWPSSEDLPKLVPRSHRRPCAPWCHLDSPNSVYTVGVLTVLLRVLDSFARAFAAAVDVFPSFLHIKMDLTFKNAS